MSNYHYLKVSDCRSGCLLTFEFDREEAEVVRGAPAEEAAQPVRQLHRGDERPNADVHLLISAGNTTEQPEQPRARTQRHRGIVLSAH